VAGQLRQPLIELEPLAEGNPNLRSDLVVLEPLAEGYRNLRVAFVLIESLQPVEPESHMLSTPFPGFGNNISNPAIPAAADPASSGLPGLAFSVHKIPLFNTNLDEAASGNEIATSLTQYPRWKYELTYDFLEDSSGANSSLKKIMGFFLQCRGRFQTWLFKDPDDYLVTAGQCGTADGVTTQFYFCRTMGGFVEPIGQVDQANTIHVYVNGVLKTPVTDYNIVLPNKIVFVSAPVSGPITADFQFFFICRFLDDEKDYEKFADKLWNLNTCEFRSVIQQ
jgi:uncharacterized protein (TIGR02217 family)